VLVFNYFDISTRIRQCVSTDAGTECYVTTSDLLAVRSEVEFCRGFVYGIVVSDTEMSMEMGVLCFLNVV
jgi:hypothetical protein